MPSLRGRARLGHRAGWRAADQPIRTVPNPCRDRAENVHVGIGATASATTDHDGSGKGRARDPHDRDAPNRIELAADRRPVRRLGRTCPADRDLVCVASRGRDVTGERRCYRCGTLHSRTHAWCHTCHAANMRATRPRYRDLAPQAKQRLLARNQARVYAKRGKIARGPCEVCGTDRDLQMHHDDYGEPLVVRWLCRSCHAAHHRETRVAQCVKSTRGTLGKP